MPFAVMGASPVVPVVSVVVGAAVVVVTTGVPPS
jgi:hypothetical protein